MMSLLDMYQLSKLLLELLQLLLDATSTGAITISARAVAASAGVMTISAGTIASIFG